MEFSSERLEFQNDVKTMMAETMPMSEEALKAKWQETAESVGVDVKTQDKYNPFWRMITQLVTLPVLWLQNFLAVNVMPNLFLKYATGPWLVAKAWEMHVEPKTKRKAQVMITFTRLDASETLTVPVLSEINSSRINGVVFKLFSMTDTDFQVGQTEVDILCEAESEGESYNLATGYFHVLPKVIDGVVSVSNKSDSLIQPGTDDETDDELRARVRDKWDTQFQWHVETVYKNLVASFDGVSVNNVFFNGANPRAENSADGLIMFDVGEPSVEFINNINDTIQNEQLFGLGDDFQVKAMPITFHDVTCIYSLKNEMSEVAENQLVADIEDFIKAAFRNNAGGQWDVTKTKPFESFSFGLLTFELFSVFGSKIKQFRFANDDIENGLEIPKLSSLTVTKL